MSRCLDRSSSLLAAVFAAQRFFGRRGDVAASVVPGQVPFVDTPMYAVFFVRVSSSMYAVNVTSTLAAEAGTVAVTSGPAVVRSLNVVDVCRLLRWRPCRSCAQRAGSAVAPVASCLPSFPSLPSGPVTPEDAGHAFGAFFTFRTSRATGPPLGPVGPVGPVLPSAPVEPVTPVRPILPSFPSAPVGPVGPVTPCTPVTPVTPLAPSFPSLRRPSLPSTPWTPFSPVAPFSPSCRSHLLSGRLLCRSRLFTFDALRAFFARGALFGDDVPEGAFGGSLPSSCRSRCRTCLC